MRQQIPIFVISLPDAVERRAPLMAKLEEYELSCEILEAVNCRDGVPHVFEPLLCYESMIKDYGRCLLPAEVGCALSHHIAYRKISGGGYDAVIVLEDDAIVTRAFAEFAKQGCDSDIDLLLLYHRRAAVCMKGPETLNGGSKAYLVKNMPGGAAGYLITPKASDYLIKNSLPLSRTADWPISLTEIKSFVAHPQLVHHPKYEKGAHSYINNDRIEIGNQIKKKNRKKWRRGLSRILRGTFFKPSYWKMKVEKRKLRQYKTIS